MIQKDEAEWLARLKELTERGNPDDLEEMARLLGQVDPYKLRQIETPTVRPSLLARLLTWYHS